MVATKVKTHLTLFPTTHWALCLITPTTAVSHSKLFHIAETGQVIKFRKTSMFAFNEMMQGAEMGWGPCDVDL